MTNHLIIDLTAPADVLRLRCTRCGQHLDLSLPVRVDHLPAIHDMFHAMHAGCEPRKEQA